MIKQIFRFLTGGRPMTCMGFAFNDIVSNKPVYYYQDQFNRYWLSFGSWSLFRVPSKESHVGSYERLKQHFLNSMPLKINNDTLQNENEYNRNL